MNREEWLHARKLGIGGSEIGSILGVNKYKTAYDVWLDKTGRGQEVQENNSMHFGTVLEQVVADEFTLRTGKRVRRINDIVKSKTNPILLASIDRKIEGENSILECKTASWRTAREFGTEGTDEVPASYLLQCMHYLECTGYKKAYLAVLIDGRDYRIYSIDYNEELASLINEKATEFWESYVITDIPPPVSTVQEIDKVYKICKKESVIEATSELIPVVEEYKTTKERIKELEAELEAKELLIKEYIKDNEVLLYNGSPLVTWKNSVSKRFDSTALKTENAELYQKYLNESISRRFTVK